jgi:hypothetical protein
MANYNQPWNLGKYAKHTLPTLKPTTRDIAWAAGVYEGEGTCSVYTHNHGKKRNGEYTTISMRVAQKDPWLCHRLRDLFGGTVRSYQTKANSPKDPELVRTYHAWDTTGSRALGILQTFYILLSPRRQEQIRVVLDAVRR